MTNAENINLIQTRKMIRVINLKVYDEISKKLSILTFDIDNYSEVNVVNLNNQL